MKILQIFKYLANFYRFIINHNSQPTPPHYSPLVPLFYYKNYIIKLHQIPILSVINYSTYTKNKKTNRAPYLPLYFIV